MVENVEEKPVGSCIQKAETSMIKKAMKTMMKRWMNLKGKQLQQQKQLMISQMKMKLRSLIDYPQEKLQRPSIPVIIIGILPSSVLVVMVILSIVPLLPVLLQESVLVRLISLLMIVGEMNGSLLPDPVIAVKATSIDAINREIPVEEEPASAHPTIASTTTTTTTTTLTSTTAIVAILH